VNITWLEGAPAPVKDAHHNAVLHDGKVYIGGGFGSYYTINIYTPANNSWSPSPINNPYKYFAMTTLNNHLITAGGMRNKVTNKIFLLDGDQLKECNRMITPRRLATAAGYQGKLIIAGGRDDQNETLVTTELFKSATGQWYSVNDLPLPHYELKSVIVNNVLYLLGGADSSSLYSHKVFTASLDTLSNNQLKWGTQLDTPSTKSAPVSIQGRHLLIVGGFENDVTRNIYVFNKVSHRWQVIGQIPSARRESAVVSIANNKIVVIGGVDDKRQYANTVWIGSCEPQ